MLQFWLALLALSFSSRLKKASVGRALRLPLLFGNPCGCPTIQRTRVSSALRIFDETRGTEEIVMIRKLKSGKYRLYSRKKDSRTGKRKNLGTFNSKGAAKKHERAVQYFKHH